MMRSTRNGKEIFRDEHPIRGSFSRLAVILAALVWLCAFGSAADAAAPGEFGYTFEDGGLNYEVLTDTTTVKVIPDGPPSSYAGSIVIPSTVTPYTVTAIGDNAFYQWPNLGPSVTIPASVTNIGSQAFSYCTALSSVTFLETVPPTFGTGVFTDFNAQRTMILHVPTGTRSAYETALGFLSGSQQGVVTITITDGTPFVAVTNITGVPDTTAAGMRLSLSGTVAPTNATYQTITWSLSTADAGTTGASISDGILYTTAAGTVTVTATIANGLSLTAPTDYTQDFPIDVLPTVATPTANPAGDTYTADQYVALSTTTAGAAIYYTLDGSTPTTLSTLYSDTAPIYLPLGTTATLQAIAVLPGWNDSDVMSEDYVVAVTLVPPAITTETLPNCAVGVAYSADLAATGTAPITWAVTSGDLPGGLTLNRTAGTLSGTPTTAETFTFTVKAENSAGSATKEFTVTIGTPPAITTDTGLKTCYFSSDYITTLKATGSLPISWELVSALPLGLKMNSSGVIYGKVYYGDAGGGIHKFTVEASNSYGSDTREFKIILSDSNVLTDTNNDKGCVNTGVGTVATFFVSLGALLAPRLRRRKK